MAIAAAKCSTASIRTSARCCGQKRRNEKGRRSLRAAAAFRSSAFLQSLGAGCFSGALSLLVRYLDDELGLDIDPSLPNLAIFSAFITFASLVASFRTSSALGRYTSAGNYVHRMTSAWYHATSTLISFCRGSDRPAGEVESFQQVLVRLVSAANAICMTDLQSVDGRPFGRSLGFSFEVLALDDLDPQSREFIMKSEQRVEAVFHMIQSLVVDAHRSRVLNISPPLLTRAFQELGLALTTFHEAKMVGCVPLPYAYGLFTQIILFIQAVFMPLMAANFARSVIGSCCFAFFGTFLVWFLNKFADTLDNPFRKEANTLDLSSLQQGLNDYLLQLLRQARRRAPHLERHGDGLRLRAFSSLGDGLAQHREEDCQSEQKGSGASSGASDGLLSAGEEVASPDDDAADRRPFFHCIDPPRADARGPSHPPAAAGGVGTMSPKAVPEPSTRQLADMAATFGDHQPVPVYRRALFHFIDLPRGDARGSSLPPAAAEGFVGMLPEDLPSPRNKKLADMAVAFAGQRPAKERSAAGLDEAGSDRLPCESRSSTDSVDIEDILTQVDLPVTMQDAQSEATSRALAREGCAQRVRGTSPENSEQACRSHTPRPFILT